MFDPKVVGTLASEFRGTLEQLGLIETRLNQRLMAMEDPIRALMMAVATGEPLVFVGPPGTAKSRLIRNFCALVGLVDEDNPAADHNTNYFEYLMTPFTEPGELFGFYDLTQVQKGVLSRMDDGMMQHAQVVFLDEIFNASSAILNSLLTVMNERVFHDRGRRVEVSMRNLFSATNQVPDAPELMAVFDRFLLRCFVDNIEARPDQIGKLYAAGWQETYSEHDETVHEGLLDDLARMRKAIRKLTSAGTLRLDPDDPIFRNITLAVSHVRDRDLSQMSNRRMVKSCFLMLLHRIYRAVLDGEEGPLQIGAPELALIPKFLLDAPDREASEKLERMLYQAS